MAKKTDIEGFGGSLLQIIFTIAKAKETFLILPILTVAKGIQQLYKKKRKK